MYNINFASEPGGWGGRNRIKRHRYELCVYMGKTTIAICVPLLIRFIFGESSKAYISVEIVWEYTAKTVYNLTSFVCT